MDLYLEIISGDGTGMRFKLANGLKVGRKKCDITIEDPKISSYHATILARGPADQLKFYLKDNNSSNGVKFNDLRVPELYLAPGVEFRLGSTKIRVVDLSPQPEKKLEKPRETGLKTVEKPKSEKPKAERPPKPAEKLTPEKVPPKPPTVMVAPAAPQPAPPISLPPIPTWREVLLRLLQNASLRAEDVIASGVQAFNPPLKLLCVRGRQYGKSWILGYGPRSVGPKSLDVVLTESSAPPICFEIIPTSRGAEFKTQHPKIVKLNGQNVTKMTLNAGDKIEIVNSQLVVEFEYARD